MTESERTGVQPYIWESNALKVGRNSVMLQSSRRADLSLVQINGPSRTTERISCYKWRKLISQVRHPHRPQQLRCWEKMKTLMFSRTSKHRAWIACETLLTLQLLNVEKMKDTEPAEGGNYSNAGLSIKSSNLALRNMTSHCGESQNDRPIETDLV